MANKPPTYKLLDLFCGAGGLSLGFEDAGFSVVKAIDIDKWSVETYNHNRKHKVAEIKDISAMDDSYMDELGKIDGIIGGPPCQGFSTAGQRIIDDERNKLYREYFRVLGHIRPKFFILENVTGMLNFAKGLIKEDIIKRADAMGYKLSYKVLDMADFGIPQFRKRVFFIGFRKDLVLSDYIFPEWHEKPITIEDAIGDLPLLDTGNIVEEYDAEPFTEYQRKMRNGMIKLFNHVLSIHTERTKKTISMIPEGGSIMDLPEELRGGRNYHALLRKMDHNKPALCIDTGHRTYFHYKELRIPSTREVARLQSFPDSYVFIGPRNDQQRQVGNAVPPIIASILAESIHKYLNID